MANDDWGNDPIVKGAPPAPAAPSVPGKVSTGEDWGNDPIQSAVAAPATPPAAGQPGMLDRLGSYLMRPVRGFNQALAHVPDLLPSTPAMQQIEEAGKTSADTAVKQGEQTIQAARGGDKGFDWLGLAVDMANPINYAPLGAAKALGVAEKALPAVGGAATALVQPVEDAANYGKEKGEQALAGAIGGKVGETAGKAVSSAVAPALGTSAKMLTDLGIRLTPGQMAGGVTRRAEDSLGSIPVVGSLVRRAQRDSIEDFNRATLNKALEPIGVKLPPDIPVGRDAIGYAQKAASDNYDHLLSGATFQVTVPFHQDMQQLATLVSEMPGPQRDQFGSIISNRVMQRLQPTGTMDGQTFKQVESELTNYASQYRSSSDAAQRQLGSAIDEVNHALRENLERTNPNIKDELAKANASYAMLSRVEDASMVRKTPDGTFMPSDLLGQIRSASRRTGRRKAFARGDAMMQDVAESGQDVLPSKVPDSGTPERAAWGALLGGGAFEYPKTAAALGAASLPYTRPGLAASRWFAQPGPARQATGNMMRDASQYLTTPGALAAMGIYP